MDVDVDPRCSHPTACWRNGKAYEPRGNTGEARKSHEPSLRLDLDNANVRQARVTGIVPDTRQAGPDFVRAVEPAR